MRHHLYNPDFKFVVEPESFNKYTDRELLQYCLGATMYMPARRISPPRYSPTRCRGLTTIVLCFEDACPEDQVEAAEENVHKLLETVTAAVDRGELSADRVPLIFVRVRQPRPVQALRARADQGAGALSLRRQLPQVQRGKRL